MEDGVADIWIGLNVIYMLDNFKEIGKPKTTCIFARSEQMQYENKMFFDRFFR